MLDLNSTGFPIQLLPHPAPILELFSLRLAFGTPKTSSMCWYLTQSGSSVHVRCPVKEFRDPLVMLVFVYPAACNYTQKQS